MKFDISGFFKNLFGKFNFNENLTRIKGTLHEDQYTLFIISRSFLLRMRNAADTNCKENQITHFGLCNFFFFENRAVYEIMWKNAVQRGTQQVTIWGMRFTC
jgi:hypothetical protein